MVLNPGMEGYVTNQALVFLVEALKTQQPLRRRERAYAAAFPDHLMHLHLGPRGNQIVARAIARSGEDHPEKWAPNETRGLGRAVTFCLRFLPYGDFSRVCRISTGLSISLFLTSLPTS
jgi:hypothetical protein